jgi:hypothetical protein
MKSTTRTGTASGAQPSVLEVVGHGVGHVYVSRAAANVLAPGGVGDVATRPVVEQEAAPPGNSSRIGNAPKKSLPSPCREV